MEGDRLMSTALEIRTAFYELMAEYRFERFINPHFPGPQEGPEALSETFNRTTGRAVERLSVWWLSEDEKVTGKIVATAKALIDPDNTDYEGAVKRKEITPFEILPGLAQTTIRDQSKQIVLSYVLSALPSPPLPAQPQ